MALAVAINCLAGAKPGGACVLALGNISDRMEKGLSQQAGSLWRAIGRCAVRAKCRKRAGGSAKARPESRQAADFRHLTFAGDTPQLANVKAVDDIYRCMAICKPIPLA